MDLQNACLDNFSAEQHEDFWPAQYRPLSNSYIRMARSIGGSSTAGPSKIGERIDAAVAPFIEAIRCLNEPCFGFMN
jgi:hypothetical protein